MRKGGICADHGQFSSDIRPSFANKTRRQRCCQWYSPTACNLVSWGFDNIRVILQHLMPPEGVAVAFRVRLERTLSERGTALDVEPPNPAKWVARQVSSGDISAGGNGSVQLFIIVAPDVACFGKKDYQQLKSWCAGFDWGLNFLCAM